MQKRCHLRLILLIALLLSPPALFAALLPGNLFCEYRSNPLGVDSAQPRLGWTLQSSQRGDKQTAYQILTASSPALLDANTGDLWDSGPLVSGQQNQISYNGSPLQTAQQVFWKVRVWNVDGIVSPWSAAAMWTMGVLNTNDWQAQWIMGLQRKSIGYHAQTATTQNTTKWVQVDLGVAYPITSIRLHPKWHQAILGYGFPVRFRVEISNDPTFASLTTVTNVTTDFVNPGYFPVPFTVGSVSARYVRVTATKLYFYAANNYAFALSQLEVISGGTNVALNKTVSSLDTIEQFGWGAAGLTDGAGFGGCDYGRRLRREFIVQPGLKRAIAHVSGLGQYELFVNGNKTGEDLLSPGWTAYGKTVLYDTRDVTAQLQPGTNNAIGLILGNSIYNIGAGYGRYVKFQQSFGPLRAIVQLRLEYTNGTSQIIGSDATWQTGPGAITFENFYAGEDYDARLEPTGWSNPGFTNTTWTAAVLTNGPGGTLKGLSCAAPPIGKHDVFIPIATNIISATTNVYDLGQNASVMPQLQVSGPAGSYVRIIPSELLGANGLVDRTTCTQDGVRPAWWQYTLKGGGTENWFPQFFYHGSRYFQVERYAAPGGGLPSVQLLQGVVVHSTSTPIGTFRCSNPLFNDIYDLVRWAQRNNMMSLMTDCPARERLGWLEEVHLNGPSLRYNFDFAPLFSKIQNDIADSQWTNNGFVPNIAPEYFQTSASLTDPYHNSPEWGSTFIQGAWQQYQFSGDVSLLQRFYPAMKNYVNFLTSTTTANYIVTTDLGDWYDLGQINAGVFSGVTLTTPTLPGTAIYYSDAVILAQMAQVLGNSADVATYNSLAANIRAGFNATFLKTNGVYDTSSQTANAMPLALGLVEATNIPTARAAMVADIQSRGNTLTSGEIGFGFLLRALTDAGRADVVYAMNNQTNAPGYGYQIVRGATALAERWDAANTTFSSQDHFMLGEIMEWFYHGVVGIRPDISGPGFKKIIIQPAIVGDLTSAAATYNSISGLITNQWSLNSNQVTMNVAIPPGTTARVYLPTLRTDLSGLTIKESGTIIWTNGAAAGSPPSVTFVATELVGRQTSVVWDIGSGNYQFIWNLFPAPSGLVATAANSRVNLNWNTVVGTTRYNVKRGVVSGGPYTTIAGDVTGTDYSDRAVTNGGTYFYVISAQTQSGESQDSFEVNATPQFVSNYGFETPTTSTFQYNPSGGSWNFMAQSGNHGSGITANNSLFSAGNPKAPQGIQSAFLQGTATISQAVSGFVPGVNYSVAFAAAQRATFQHGGQTWSLKLDGTVLGNYSTALSATNYVNFTTNFIASAATRTLTFVGTDLLGGDNTVFLDNVRLDPAPSLTPLQLGWQMVNGQLQFQWPLDHFGWHLETQTNPDAAGLGTNWTAVAGSQATNLFFVPLNHGTGSAFFRLAYP
jgi:Tfp pilus assembly major pilin PilA